MEKENFIITLEEQQIVELLRMYTENNKDKNEIVLDNCCGSGTIKVAKKI